jgi:glycosyltransferase involved in cell wall biosynthesis
VLSFAGDDYAIPGWWQDGVTTAVDEALAGGRFEKVLIQNNQFLLENFKESVAKGGCDDVRRQTLLPHQTMGRADLLVTILINNYNYGRFLRHAIDSALNQTYPNIEVVVVDDGSTDDSRDIIGSYGTTIKPILKNNEGQTSTFNAGFAASHGEIICLLDADDCFHLDKVERVIPYSKPGSMLYHRLRVEPGPGTNPRSLAPDLDYHVYAQRYGFLPYIWSPTSGLVFRRDLALKLMPLPTKHVRVAADGFLVRGAALIGQVVGIPDVLATYRVHGENGWYGKSGLNSPEFMAELERYLNLKLTEHGKKPMIDFYNSLFAFDYVPQRAVDLARLGVIALKRHPDVVTLKFLLRALFRAMRCAIGRPVPLRNRRGFSFP